MSPVQALQAVEQMRRAFKCNGSDHDALKEALAVLAKVVVPPPAEEKAEQKS